MSQLVLLLETSEQECSIAIATQSGLIAEHRLIAPRQHADLLIPSINTVLSDGGISPRQLTAIAITHGPGAFTGIRIGVAMAQGLAYGWDIPCVPVNTLDLWALTAFTHCDWSHVICLMDARMGELYCGQYERVLTATGDIKLTALAPPCCVSPSDLLQQLSSSTLQQAGVIGSGAGIFQQTQGIDKNAIQVLPQGPMQLCLQAYGHYVMQLLKAGVAVNALELDAFYLRAAVASF